jgi:GNAT superfamily N-acetyltransferase
MIHKIVNDDFEKVLAIINEAAVAYKGKIPEDCWKDPYMFAEELHEEFKSGVQFYGYIEKGAIIAVMGIQPVQEVTLIRHAYTISTQQRRGIGEILLKQLLSLVRTNRVLVGTWESAPWAIKFYQKHSFELLSRKETNSLLRKYWNIPERQVEASVVLELKRQ